MLRTTLFGTEFGKRFQVALFGLVLLGALMSGGLAAAGTGSLGKVARDAVADAAVAVADVETAEAGCYSTYDTHFGAYVCVTFNQYLGNRWYNGWVQNLYTGRWVYATFYYYTNGWIYLR